MNLGVLDIDTATWLQLRDVVARQLGLDFPPARLAEFQRGVCEAAGESGAARPADFLRQLLGPAADARLWQLLARHLTISETYFLRDPELMDTLARRVLPKLVHARRLSQNLHLHLWSAGCASGEEPYSLAILLHQLLPDLHRWKLQLVGTDINTELLDRARLGHYRDWSLRATPPAVRARYFRQAADARYAIAAEVQKLVGFHSLNLVQDAYPEGVDLILCRNVLMYLTPEAMRRVVRRLHGALVPGGWLVVGPAEWRPGLFSGFEPITFPGATLLRKLVPAAASDRRAAGPSSCRSRPMPLLTAGRAPRRAGGGRTAPASLEGRAAAGRLGARARSLADEGRLREALASCELWIAEDNLAAAAHWLRGVILIELGDVQQARKSLRTAMLLDPDHLLSHVALAGLAGRQHPAEAVRHLARARDLLAGYRPADLVPDGGGLNAAALARMLPAGDRVGGT